MDSPPKTRQAWEAYPGTGNLTRFADQVNHGNRVGHGAGRGVGRGMGRGAGRGVGLGAVRGRRGARRGAGGYAWPRRMFT